MRGRIMMSNHALGMSYICNRVSGLHMCKAARDIPMTERAARSPQGRASETETRVRSEREGSAGRLEHINYGNKRGIRVRGANAN